MEKSIKTIAAGLLFLALVPFLPAQPSPNPPAFDVTSVKLRTGIITIMRDPFIKGRTVTSEASTLLDLIEYTYGLRHDQISGQPKWVEENHYDVVAKSEGEGVLTAKESRRMYEALLSDRFQLQFHWETVDVPMYGLVVGKNGPKFKESAADAKGGFVRGGAHGHLHMEMKAGTMLDIANQLSLTAGRPVVDRTGLTGTYAFTLEWFPQNVIPPADVPVTSMFDALQEQLGLRLESITGPLRKLVIDHVAKPSEN